MDEATRRGTSRSAGVVELEALSDLMLAAVGDELDRGNVGVVVHVVDLAGGAHLTTFTGFASSRAPEVIGEIAAGLVGHDVGGVLVKGNEIVVSLAKEETA